MADVVLEFEDRFVGPDGRAYQARVCGRAREDGLWEGWIEFVAVDQTVRTGRETTQPSWDQLRYWATGLTAGYLDGALMRTLKAPPPPSRTISHATPAFDRPAPHPPVPPPPAGTATTAQAAVRPVLDPFAVYAEGDHVLHGQLEALSEGQLRTIVRAFGLAGPVPGATDGMNRYELAHHILAEVRLRAGG